jgi:hypothetical protein
VEVCPITRVGLGFKVIWAVAHTRPVRKKAAAKRNDLITKKAG